MKLNATNINKVLRVNNIKKENIKYGIYDKKCLTYNGKRFYRYNPDVQHSPMDVTDIKHKRIKEYIQNMINVITSEFDCKVQWNSDDSVRIFNEKDDIIFIGTEYVKNPDYPDYKIAGIQVH